MVPSFYRLLAAVALVAGAGPALAGVVTYTDTTFNLADYTASPSFSSDPSATLTYSSSAGTLQFVATFTSTPAAEFVSIGLANQFFTYNPATQGAITDFSASVNKNIFLNPAESTTSTFHPLVEQDGVFYLASIPGPGCTSCTTTGEQTISQSGLTAADFDAYDFATGAFTGANPNFGVGGDPMLLGIAQISSLAGAGTQTITVQYQDLTLSIATVPEPGTVTLLGLALAGLGFARKRTRGQ